MTDHLDIARARLEVGNWPSAQANALIDIAESLRKLVDAQKPKTVHTVGIAAGGGTAVGYGGGGGGGGGSTAGIPVAREVASLDGASTWARTYRWIDRDGEEWRYLNGSWRIRLKDGQWSSSVVPDDRYGMYRRLA